MSCMSLKTLYMSWIYVVNIFLRRVSLIVRSGVLKRTASVFMVYALHNLRIHISNISSVEHLGSCPHLLSVCSSDSLQFQNVILSSVSTSVSTNAVQKVVEGFELL